MFFSSTKENEDTKKREILLVYAETKAQIRLKRRFLHCYNQFSIKSYVVSSLRIPTIYYSNKLLPATSNPHFVYVSFIHGVTFVRR